MAVKTRPTAEAAIRGDLARAGDQESDQAAQFASSPMSDGVRFALGLLLVIAVILGLLSYATSEDDTEGAANGPVPMLDVSWVPDGYTLFDGYTAYRWASRPPVCPTAATCWALDAVSASACSALTVTLDVLDRTGRTVARATGTTAATAARTPTLLSAGAKGDFTGERSRVTAIRCVTKPVVGRSAALLAPIAVLVIDTSPASRQE